MILSVTCVCVVSGGVIACVAAVHYASCLVLFCDLGWKIGRGECCCCFRWDG